MMKKKSWLKKIATGFLLTILVLAALIYAPFWDVAPPDVSDLAVERVEVPPEENAYTCFLQATNLIWKNVDFPFSLYQQGRTNDDAVVSAYITTNQAAIAWIRRGVTRQHCQLPLIKAWNPYVHMKRPLSSSFDIGRLITTQARFERLQGRMSEATDAALLMMRYGSHLQQASDLFIDYLVASGIVSMGLGQAEDLARDPRCSATERARLSAGLIELEAPSTGLVRAVKGEAKYTAEMLQQIKTVTTTQYDLAYDVGSVLKRSMQSLATHAICLPNYFMQYNRTRHLMVDDFRMLIAHASSPYAEHPLRDMDMAPGDIGVEFNSSKLMSRRNPSAWTRLPFANAIGRKLWKYLNMSYGCIIRTTCRQEFHLSAIRLLLACRAYEEATGRLPETLQALVPDYLPSVPRDPFDGSPLRYSAERRLVYSVGENLVDDGGADDGQRGWRRAKDIVFEMEW